MWKKRIQEMYKIIGELSSAQSNMMTVLGELKYIDDNFQKKKLNYNQYYALKRKILRNKSKEEIISLYNNYVSSLKNQLLRLNSQLVVLIHQDESYKNLVYDKAAKKPKELTHLPPLSELEISEVDIAEAKEEVREIKFKEIKTKQEKQVAQIKNEFAETLEEQSIEIPMPEELKLEKPPTPAKLSFFKRLIYAIKAKEKPWAKDSEVKLGSGFFSKEFFAYLFKGKTKEKQEDVFGQTKILPSILSYEDSITKATTKTDVLNPTLLEKQIKELKKIISEKKPEVYQASTLGYVANLTVRKISIAAIERYPEFFKKVYKSIRYAGLKILANTYINVVFFLTLFFGFVSFPVLMTFFSLKGDMIAIAFLKTILGFFIVSGFTFWLGFYYPRMKAKTRKRSINTNLPFAIDHMSSVIASGVSPATMFKLISTSREYGEISIEIEKVINYIDFFGYDILTALKAVALITPSDQFKEFIDGFVSTIETGGDLKQYLHQKSGEALLNYRLERQKYVESLGTYSDIYTGVLIAAPLFFVTSLSLVSVLGGTIGGMSVNTIITVGTYIVIPALNLLFLIFLEMSQPEI